MGNSFFKNKKADDQKINKVVLDEAVSNEITRFSGDLMQDSHYIKQLYSYPTNIDFVLREFTTNGMEKRAALFYIPSMTDAKIIEEEIIKPLGGGIDHRFILHGPFTIVFGMPVQC